MANSPIEQKAAWQRNLISLSSAETHQHRWSSRSTKLYNAGIVNIWCGRMTGMNGASSRAHLSMIETAGVIPAPVHTSTTDVTDEAAGHRKTKNDIFQP